MPSVGPSNSGGSPTPIRQTETNGRAIKGDDGDRVGCSCCTEAAASTSREGSKGREEEEEEAAAHR